MSATGKLEANISSRISTLDGLNGAIPKGQGAPNDDWSQQAEKLVKIRDVRNQLALKILWDSQVRTRVWPPAISKFMSKCPYRGELEDRNEKERVPDLFRDNYDNEVARVWKLPFPRQDMTDPNRPKIVDFPASRMPRIPASTWRGIVPTWPEIWNASEDLWLLEQLLSSVQRTNSFASNLLDANVKQIEVVELFGGRRLGPSDAPAAVAGGSGFGGGSEGTMGGGHGTAMPGMPAVGGGATAASPVNSAEFNIGEEYEVKSRFSALAGGGGGGIPGLGIEGSAGTGLSMPMGGGHGAGSNTATGGATGANPSEGRYVQDTPAFRTRGFRLKVIIRQQNAMELVRELLNSKYPIEIVRIQQFALNPAFGVVSGGATGSGSGGFGGFPMPAGGLGSEGLGAIPMPTTGDLGIAGGADPLATLGAGVSEGAAGAVGGAQEAMVYQDTHLVSLVILGELYIYNEPKLPEAAPNAPADPNAAQSPSADLNADSNATGEPSGAPATPAVGIDATATPNSAVPMPNSQAAPANGAATGNPASNDSQ